MDAFRSQGLKSVIYASMIVAIIVVFAVQFQKQPGGGKGTTKHDCVAEVRGECLSSRDYRASLSLAAPRGTEEQIIKRLQLRKRVLDGLVERALLVRDADRLGLTVSDDDLNDELTSGHAYLSVGVETSPMEMQLGMRLPLDKTMRLLEVKQNGVFDRKTYEKSLKMSVGRGPKEFRDQQKQELIAARMKDLVRARVRVSDVEAFESYKREKNAASIKYVSVSRTFAGRTVVATKEALEGYIAAHKAEVDTALAAKKGQLASEGGVSCRKARVLLVKVGLTAGDEEKAAGKKKAEDALEKLKKKKSFDEVARASSDDESKGEASCYVSGRFPRSVDDALAALKPGDRSGVLETDSGYFVVQLDAALKDADAEGALRLELARELFVKTEAEAKAAEVAKAIRSAAAEGKSLEDAIALGIAPLVAQGRVKASDEDAPKVLESSSFTRDGSPIPGAATDVAAQAFGLEKPGSVAADVAKLDDGYAVVQLLEKKAATREAFEKDREPYMARFLAMKQHDAVVAYVLRLKDAAKPEIKVNASFLEAPVAADEE
jgi:peptidyl-prolyl cis-trans isomerase D